MVMYRSDWWPFYCCTNVGDEGFSIENAISSFSKESTCSNRGFWRGVKEPTRLGLVNWHFLAVTPQRHARKSIQCPISSLINITLLNHPPSPSLPRTLVHASNFSHNNMRLSQAKSQPTQLTACFEDIEVILDVSIMLELAGRFWKL